MATVGTLYHNICYNDSICHNGDHYFWYRDNDNLYYFCPWTDMWRCIPQRSPSKLEVPSTARPSSRLEFLLVTGFTYVIPTPDTSVIVNYTIDAQIGSVSN